MSPKHINRWFVVGKEDENSCFSYSQVTPKGEWFNTFEEAEIERNELQKLTNDKLFIFRRTCEVL